MSRTYIMCAAAAATMLLAGCDTVADLEPAPIARESLATPGAVNSEAGIRLVAAAPEWPGEIRVASEVTPMRLTIENRGDRPVSVTYANLRLVGSEGATYSALPLYRISGTVQEPVTVRGYGPIANPGFDGTRFDLAPYYGGLYPGYPHYTGPFYLDRGWYDAYDTYYADVSLPTPRMRTLALPEGVLNPGGRVEGWVYFEKVPEDIRQVSLRADLESARTGRTFAELRVPFRVEG